MDQLLICQQQELLQQIYLLELSTVQKYTFPDIKQIFVAILILFNDKLIAHIDKQKYKMLIINTQELKICFKTN